MIWPNCRQDNYLQPEKADLVNVTQLPSLTKNVKVQRRHELPPDRESDGQLSVSSN